MESPSDGKRAVSACNLAKGADAWLCPSVSFTVVRPSAYQMSLTTGAPDSPPSGDRPGLKARAPMQARPEQIHSTSREVEACGPEQMELESSAFPSTSAHALALA